MDFRLLLAVGIALGGSALALEAKVSASYQGEPLRWSAHTGRRVMQCMAPLLSAQPVLQSSTLKNAVFRTVDYHPRAEGQRVSGSYDELPLKADLPVWIF